MPAVSRRSTLLGLGSAIVLGRVSLALADAATEKRFVVVILRGALDGMSAVVPYGDPALLDLRGEIVPPQPGNPGGLLDLGGFFGLHPSLGNVHAMYRANELLVVHAVAGPYRIRSHFEAQDCMESGADHRMTSGWLNRVVSALPPAAANRPEGDALAVGITIPLLLRGPALVASWAPHGLVVPEPDDLYRQVAALHEGDPITGPAIAEGLRERAFSADVMKREVSAAGNRNTFSALAMAAGEMLAAPDGPRIAAFELGGWDTHIGQSARLEANLKQLDAGIDSLKAGLGASWRNTAILIITEFGRTARVNGTKGTDHGTGTVAFLVGGAVAGGRVLGEWPGLGPDRLFENRDLQPTTDVRSVTRGVLKQHLGLSDSALAAVFPASTRVAALENLVRVVDR